MHKEDEIVSESNIDSLLAKRYTEGALKQLHEQLTKAKTESRRKKILSRIARWEKENG